MRRTYNDPDADAGGPLHRGFDDVILNDEGGHHLGMRTSRVNPSPLPQLPGTNSDADIRPYHLQPHTRCLTIKAAAAF